MKSKKFISMCVSVMMVVTLLAVSAPVLASPATAVSIGSAAVGQGQTAIVSITIQTDEQLGSATIRLQYNQAVVKVNSVSGGDLGNVEANIDNTNGRTTMGAAYGSVPGKTGTIKFTDVTLEALGSPGSSSPLTVTVVDMYNSDVNPITPETVNNGNFSIISPLKYILKVNISPVAGGTVALNPPQPQDGYDVGTVVTLTATANLPYTFYNWTGDLTGNTNPATLILNSNKSVTANFKAEKYPLTINANPVAGGTVAINPAQPAGGYEVGTVVTLTATANAGYTFANWSGDLTGNNNPATLILNANITVTANFNQITPKYTLIVNINPAGGGTVILNPPQPQGGYDAGTVVTVTATANAGYPSVIWTGDLTGNTNPANITMNSNKSITANFEIMQYFFTITANPVMGGTVNLNPPPHPQGGYDAGTVVTLTANANANFTFSNWSGDLTGNTNPIIITMNSNKNVTANFFGPFHKILSVTCNPAGGGIVTLNPAPPPEGYDPETVVTLTAVPNSGYTFDYWSGDLTGNTNPTTITLNSYKSVTANFTPVFSLTVNINPPGAGTVKLPPPDNVIIMIYPPPPYFYRAGTVLTVAAVPNPGYIFDYWSGDLTGNTNPVTITMNSNKTITANFCRNPFTAALKVGWNILSTPIALSTNHSTFDKILDVSQLQIAYRWDASVQPQRWVQVTTAYQVKPLEAFYVKVSADTKATFVAYEGISSPPFRGLFAGLNLIGPAPSLEQGTFYEMPLNQALISIEQAVGGIRGYSIVCSPQLNQPGWIYIIGNASVPNLLPYKGYWVFMENSDIIAGFSTTPIP